MTLPLVELAGQLGWQILPCEMVTEKLVRNVKSALWPLVSNSLLLAAS